MDGLTRSLVEFASGLRWMDLVDVLAVALILYWILVRLKGTRALQMAFGLVVLGFLYLLAQEWEMNTLVWLLGSFFASIVIVVVVLFQNEIRRGLALVGRNPLTGATVQETEHMLEELVKAASSLSAKRIGALIVLERTNSLRHFIERGVAINGSLSRELLLSIFMPFSPIHDGAVIVSGGKVAAARCFLPLTGNPRLEKVLGTRHRAALGVSEETDAVVIVVSEETGRISLASEGQLTTRLEADELRKSLTDLLAEEPREPGWLEKVKHVGHAETKSGN